MKKDTFENRLRLARIRSKIPDAILSMGSTNNKYPVVLDDGKTTVYISDKSKEAETRLKFELLRKSRFPAYNESYIS